MRINETNLQLLSTDIWHLHVVRWWTDIFILLASEDVKTHEMDLRSKRSIDTTYVAADRYWPLQCKLCTWHYINWSTIIIIIIIITIITISL